MGSAMARLAASPGTPAMETSKTGPPATSTTRTYTPSTTINDLPQEMLLEIVKQLLYIPHPQSISYQQLLCNLCRVKPFQPATTEHLYGSEYILRSKGTDHLLLRTLLGNPKLAALVRNLCLNPSCDHMSISDSGHGEDLSIPPEEVELFRRAVDSLNLSDSKDSERWKETINSGTCHAALGALLMLHTPNATSITINNHCWGWSPSDPHEDQSWDWWEAAIPRRDNFFTLKSPQPFSN